MVRNKSIVNKDFYDNVLLSLKRQYSEKEAVKMLSENAAKLEEDLSKARFAIGELKSENSELKFEIEKVKKDKNNIEKEYRKGFETLSKTNKRLQEDVEKWRKMFFDLQNKKSSTE